MSKARRNKAKRAEIAAYRAKYAMFMLHIHTHDDIAQAETAINGIMDGYGAIATQVDLSDMEGGDITGFWLVTVPRESLDRLRGALRAQFYGNARVEFVWWNPSYKEEITPWPAHA